MSKRAQAIHFISQDGHQLAYPKIVNLLNQAIRAQIYFKLIDMLLDKAKVDDVRVKELIHPLYDFNQPFSKEMTELC